MSFGIKSAGPGGMGGPGATLYGETPENTWHNTVFKAKLMPLTDLADRGAKKVDKVPTDDLLDDFKVGNLVGGIGKKDKQAYEGKITRILKNNMGRGYRVFILDQKDEKEIEVLPSSIVFIDPQDKNVQDIQAATADSGNGEVRDRNRSAGQNHWNIPVAENKSPKKLKHLLEFNEFSGDI